MADRFAFDVRCIPQLANHPDLGAELARLSSGVAEEVKRVSPFDEGDYVNSIGSTVLQDEGVLKGIVFSDDFKALFIEFGTGDPGPTPAFAPLRKGLDMLRGGFNL